MDKTILKKPEHPQNIVGEHAKNLGELALVEIPDHVKKIIDDYIRALHKNKIPIDKIILFGSYAQGRYTDSSDIDIALVSSIFEGNRFVDRGKIRRINLSVSSDLEILPYRPQDFTADDPFVREILETGIEII